MKLVVITSERDLKDEAAAINLLFREGLETLHLRKPGSTLQQVADMLDEIRPEFHSRIMLHDHFSLAGDYNIKGVHLNRRNPVAPQNEALVVSKSFHSLYELNDRGNWQYGFLSPIFDSISKTGYHKSFTNNDLTVARDRGIIHSGIYALGGISTENIYLAAGYGFGGVAVLGSLWGSFYRDADMDSLLGRFSTIRDEVLKY